MIFINSKLRRSLLNKITLFSAIVMVIDMSFSGVFLFSKTASANSGGVTAYEQACLNAGFDYPVAEWKCDDDNCGPGSWVNTVEVTPGTSVTGDCSSANWEVGASGADGIIAKGGNDPLQIIHGTSGTVAKVQNKFSHIIFCGNNDEPVCGNGKVEGNEQCDDGNIDDADECSNLCVPQECLLELTKTADLVEVNPGGSITYTLTLKNSGTAKCTGGGVKLRDEYDEHTAFISTDTAAAYEEPENNLIMWNFGTMLPGETENVKMIVKVDDEAACQSSIVNSAHFWSDQTSYGAPVTAETKVICETPQPVCGDGKIDSGEQCDDGNTANGDGCSSTCTTECSNPVCGDGKINQASEQCDAGANNGQVCVPGYGGTCTYCSNTCQNTTITGAYCGDGVKNGSEECDDQNNANGDGCSKDCIAEPSCPTGARIKFDFSNIENSGLGNMTNNIYAGASSTLYAEGSWIDLTKNGYMIIDNGVIEDVPGLAIERGPGWVYVSLYGGHNPPGNWERAYGKMSFENSKISGFENDAVDNQGDGIYEDLSGQDEIYWTAGNTTSDFFMKVTSHKDSYFIKYECETPQPVCGDGKIDSGEQCDDGNTANGDGCSSTCTTECSNPVCGDGKINQASEQCDAGANNGQVCVPGYGGACTYCSNACQNTTITGAYCGDGVKNGSEECDDGNSIDGDSCKNNCFLPTVPNFGAISGYKYDDADGAASTTNDRNGLLGWTINLFGSSSTSTPIATTTTNGAGYYEFTNLLPGEYSLTENMVSGWTQLSAPALQTLSGGQTSAYNNFINHKIPVVGPICGDGIVNGQEVCDNGSANGQACSLSGYGQACSYCSNTCQTINIQGPYCGDGVINGPNEQCDGGQTNCTNDCKFATQGGGGGGTVTIAVLGEAGEPVLTIDKTVNVQFANPDDEVEYKVVIKNSGNLDAIDVVLKDMLPAGFKYSVDGKTTKTWDIGNIKPGEEKTVIYKASIGGDVASGIYANIAEATASNHGKVSDITNVEVRAVEVLGAEFAETGFKLSEFLIIISLAVLAAGTAMGLKKKYGST